MSDERDGSISGEGMPDAGMSESEIAALIRSEDRLVAPSSAQINRLRRRVLEHDATRGVAATGSASEPSVADLELVSSTVSAATEPKRRLAPLLLAAAAAVLAVVTIGVVTVRSGDDVAEVEAVERVETPTPAGQACDAAPQALADGIETWRGIDNWADVASNVVYIADDRTIDPDLIELSLGALASIDADSAEGETTDVIAAARERLLAIQSSGEQPIEWEAAGAVRDVVSIVSVTPEGAGCDFGD